MKLNDVVDMSQPVNSPSMNTPHPKDCPDCHGEGMYPATPEKCAHWRFTKGCKSCEYVPEAFIELATSRLAEAKANGMPSISLKDYMKKNNVKSMNTPNCTGCYIGGGDEKRTDKAISTHQLSRYPHATPDWEKECKCPSDMDGVPWHIPGCSRYKSVRELFSDQRRELVEKVEAMLPDPMTEAERDEFHCEGSILHWGEKVLEILKDPK